jgi:hypothetical protein
MRSVRWWILGAALGVVALPVVAFAAPRFDSAFELIRAQGSYPYHQVLLADLNGDQLDDWLAISRFGGAIEVRLAQAGGFGPSRGYGFSDQTEFFRLGDLDGDGHLDLLVPCSGTTCTLRGRGDGTFEPKNTYMRTGGGALDGCLADLDLDGRADMLRLNTNSRLELRWSLAGGMLDSASVSDLPAVALAVADVEGDPLPEVLFTNGTDVSLISRPGSHEFGTEAVAGPGGSTIVTGDLNGDGRADFASGHFVYRGSSSGPVPVGSVQFEVSALADLDADGRLDAVGLESSRLVFALGAGDGAFGAKQTRPSLHLAAALAIGDVDGDDRPEAVIVDRSTMHSALYRGRSDGVYSTTAAYPTRGGSRQVIAEDVGGDGLVDLVVLGKDGALSILAGDGSGRFGAPKGLPMAAPLGRIRFADFDGDGRLDLVGLRASPPGIELRRTASPGGLGSFTELPIGSAPVDLQCGDFDGNGTIDLLVLESPGPTEWFSNLGGGSYAEGVAMAAPRADPRLDFGVVDDDSDGRSDVFSCSKQLAIDPSIDVFREFAGAQFASRGSYICGPNSSSRRATFHDLDGQKPIDAIVANDDSSGFVRASLRVVSGPIRDMEQSVSDIPPGITAILADDLDDDGRPEVVTTSNRSNVVSITQTNPDGTLAERQDVAVDDSPSAFAIADLNGDGRKDLVVVHEDAATVVVALDTKLPPIGTVPLLLPFQEPSPRVLPVRGSNPVRGSILAFVLDGFAAAPVEVTLHNVAGRVVGRWSVHGGANVQLARPMGLAPGVYLVRTAQGGHVASGRVVLL